MYAHYGIDEALTNTEFYLDRLKAEIEKNLQKYINNQHKQISHLLSQTKGITSKSVVERSKLLAQMRYELDTVKNEMEEKGTPMTDGSPLIIFRKSLVR